MPLEALHAGQVLADLVYHPLETALLRGARDRGAVVVDGLGMLVHQAALQIERWTGRAAPIAAMRAAAEHVLRPSRRPDYAGPIGSHLTGARSSREPSRSMHGEDPCRSGDVVLQGTLETLALPELLGLLAQSRKTGALWLDAANSSAVVYIVEGRCCAAESSDAGEPLDDGRRCSPGSSTCASRSSAPTTARSASAPRRPPWACEETVDLEVAIDELARLVEEWREIQAVIPSLECRIRLADELGVDELTVDRERWQLIVALDGRRSVRDLVRKTNRPVLEVCHAILALVDAGAVNVGPPPAVPVGRANGTRARATATPRSNRRRLTAPASSRRTPARTGESPTTPSARSTPPKRAATSAPSPASATSDAQLA